MRRVRRVRRVGMVGRVGRARLRLRAHLAAVGQGQRSGQVSGSVIRDQGGAQGRVQAAWWGDGEEGQGQAQGRAQAQTQVASRRVCSSCKPHKGERIRGQAVPGVCAQVCQAPHARRELLQVGVLVVLT